MTTIDTREAPGALVPPQPVTERRRRPRAPLSARSSQAWARFSAAEQVPTPGWVRRYQRWVLVADALAVTLAAIIALRVRFGDANAVVAMTAGRLSYAVVATVLSVVWLLVLAVARSYESRFLGVGSEEFKRVVTASLELTAVVAVVCYAATINLARGYVGVAMPVGTVLLLTFRYGLRRVLHTHRRNGRFCHRVLAVGSRGAVADLILQMHREPDAGFMVVSACIPGGGADLHFGDMHIPAFPADQLAMAISACHVDTVAVTQSGDISSAQVRALSWSLEGSGVSLILAPALTDVAGPRVAIRPVAGLPLLHVEEPEFTGVRRIAKSAFERGLALLLLVLAAPVMATIAIAIRRDSEGPIFFRQARIGRDGKTFRIYKFRTMHEDAEDHRDALRHLNDADTNGLLFKVRDDPRVTRIGRALRRYSLDELPQLFNVVRGEMAIVGPRPPLPSEFASYASDVRRRMLVKPGITGLWQVSGRSDLSWEDTVRLDLYYVENWSPLLDLQIMGKTLFAVARASGAY